jgi:hypothetical protein
LVHFAGMPRRARGTLAASFALGSLLAIGCSSGSSTCTAPLTELAIDCPAQFDGTVETMACFPHETFVVWMCGSTIVLSKGDSFDGVICVYDGPMHALVGAQVWTDTPTFCGNKSNTQTAGRVPDSTCTNGPATVMRACPAPDAGLTDGATDGGLG